MGFCDRVERMETFFFFFNLKGELLSARRITALLFIYRGPVNSVNYSEWVPTRLNGAHYYITYCVQY